MSVPDLEKQLSEDRRVGEILASVKDIRRRIEEAFARAGDSDSQRMAMMTLGHVADLESRLASGGIQPSDIPNIFRQVASMQAFAETIEQVVSASQSQKSDVSLDSLASRAQMQAASFMRDLHQYDGLLQFNSDAERDAYRQREEDRRKRYEAGIAEGGPQGALTASGAAYGQAVDLAVHGGSADPALMRRVDDLAASTAALRDKIVRDGGDVSKFDEDMRADLRSIMRSKGIPDDRIDALLAAHKDNPINAMKAFVAERQGNLSEREVDALDAKVKEHNSNSTASAQPAAQSDHSPSVTLSKLTADSLESVGAELKALGVNIAEHDAAPDPVHGVTAQAAPAAAPARSV